MPQTEIFTLQQQPQRRHDLAQLIYAEWQMFENWADEAAVAERLRLRNLPDSRGLTLLVLDEHDRISGTASLIDYELDDIPQRRHWLGEVLTVTEFRGQGIASALIQRCVALARQRGFATLWLYTPDQQSLYRRLGWQDVEVREVGGEQVTVMKQDL